MARARVKRGGLHFLELVCPMRFAKRVRRRLEATRTRQDLVGGFVTG